MFLYRNLENKSLNFVQYQCTCTQERWLSENDYSGVTLKEYECIPQGKLSAQEVVYIKEEK